MASFHSFILLLLVAQDVGVHSETSFRYDDFPGLATDYGELHFSGDAHLKEGNLLLTGDRFSSYGRVMRQETIQLCNASKFVASFTTEFTFLIEKKESELTNADGFAFTIARDATAPSNASFGRWLGLVDPDTNGLQSNDLVAVEFDTFRNYPQNGYPQFQDIDNNHVGLDLDSMLSINSSSLYPFKIFLGTGAPLAAKLDYDASLKKLDVYVSNNVTLTRMGQGWSLVLEHSFDICSSISEHSYVGFSAGSGTANVDFHKILSWSFSSSSLYLPHPSAGSSTSDNKSLKVILGTSLSLSALLLLVVAIWGYMVLSSRRKSEENLVQLPHEIAYTDLCVATMDFSEENLLGWGGFGSVYKGVLPEDNSLVAVKRISKDSQQGEPEFLAEVQIISRLSHRNLVKLRGWCRQKKELILVYDYMPGGSLDRLLLRNDGYVLPWELRYRILCGLAAALLYIHEDWEQQVVHRDIKCSNVMLDADFNARLGDFGLARATEHNSNNNMESATLAGTVGYMAPELCETFKFTPATDTFSFGVVAVEIVCGRKAVVSNSGGNPSLLLPWVQECYLEDRLLDAVDLRLENEFQREEAVRVLKTALMCVDFNPKKRPSMRPVHYILTGILDVDDFERYLDTFETIAECARCYENSRSRRLQDFIKAVPWKVQQEPVAHGGGVVPAGGGGRKRLEGAKRILLPEW